MGHVSRDNDGPDVLGPRRRLIKDWLVARRQRVDMRWMFHDASSFNQDISGWKCDKVTDMHSMFNGAKAFNQPIGNWNVDNV